MTMEYEQKEQTSPPADRTAGPPSEQLSSDTVGDASGSASGKPDVPAKNNRSSEDPGQRPANHKWTNPVTGTITSDKGPQGSRRRHEPQMVIKFRSMEPLGYRSVGTALTLPYGLRRLKDLLEDGEWFEYFKYDLINSTGYLGSQVETPSDTGILRDKAVVYMTAIANLRTFMQLGTILGTNDAMDDLRSKFGKGGRVKRAVEAHNALARLPFWNIWRNMALKQSGVFQDEDDGPLVMTIFVVPHTSEVNGSVPNYAPSTSVQEYMTGSKDDGDKSLSQARGGDFETDTGELFDAIVAEAEYAVTWLNARASNQEAGSVSDLQKLRVFEEALRLPMGLPDFVKGVITDPATVYQRLTNNALLLKVDDTTDDFYADPLIVDHDDEFIRVSHRSLAEDDFWWIGHGDVYAVEGASRALAIADANLYGTSFPACNFTKGKVAQGDEEIRSDRTIWYDYDSGWQDEVMFATASDYPALIYKVPDKRDAPRAKVVAESYATVKGTSWIELRDITTGFGSKFEFIPTSVEDVTQGYWYVMGTALGYPVSKP